MSINFFQYFNALIGFRCRYCKQSFYSLESKIVHEKICSKNKCATIKISFLEKLRKAKKEN